MSFSLSSYPNVSTFMSADEVAELESLRQEVEKYRWKDKKEYIIKKLGLSSYAISDWRGEIDKHKLALLQENKMIQFIDDTYKIKEVDELLLEYSFTDIVRVIKEYCDEIIQAKEEEAKIKEEEAKKEAEEKKAQEDTQS